MVQEGLVEDIIKFVGLNKRIMKQKMVSGMKFVHIFFCYAFNEDRPENEKHEFRDNVFDVFFLKL